jgi:hypothetical protein
MRITIELIVRMALENPRWGYTRIQGALGNLGYAVGRGTIANVLQREGIEPAPERGKRTPWSVFLKAHWRTIVAADFFTAEVWTIKGLITHYVLFIIELAKRIVHIVGITTHPDEAWTLQVGRNATDTLDGALTGKSHLIIDRDTKYSRRFRPLIAESGTAVIRLPPRSPSLTNDCSRRSPPLWVRAQKFADVSGWVGCSAFTMRRLCDGAAEFLDHTAVTRTVRRRRTHTVSGATTYSRRESPRQGARPHH